MNKKILIVDDDKRINGLLKDIFTLEGYEVICAYDGDEALKILDRDAGIPLMILDVMLPGVDGWEVLGYVKEHYDIRVIMLTAITDEYSEAKGLRCGADDYVVKPFKRAALIERAKRLIGYSVDENLCDLVSGSIRVSQREMKVYIDCQEIKITLKEYQLLLLLMKNSPNVLNRDKILEKIWGFEYDGNDRTIDTHIKMLRHSLGELCENIRTVRGVGYSFEGEVTKL